MVLLDIAMNFGSSAAKEAGLSIMNYIEIGSALFAIGSGIYVTFAWKHKEKYLFNLNRMAATKDKMVENTIETYRKLYMLLSHILKYIYEIQAFILAPYIAVKDDVKELYERHIASGIEKNNEIEKMLDEFGAFISTDLLLGLEVTTANISMLFYNINGIFEKPRESGKESFEYDVSTRCVAEIETMMQIIKCELGFKGKKEALKNLKKIERQKEKKN